MGLDFTIYWEEKSNPINWNDNNFHYEDFEKHILCYGRKSWELVYALNLPINSKEDPVVKKEDWVKLMDSMKDIGPKLESISDAYYKENLYNEHGGIPRDIQDLIVEYESWHLKTFDEYPILGYDFSVGYMLAFYEANEKVLKYLNDDNYIVRASISY